MDNEILKLDNQICYRLYNVSKKMTKAYNPLLKKYHLTYPQYVVMLAMFEKEMIDFKELSNFVNLAEGTLTPIINRLVKLKYIRKKQNKDDQRKIDIVLTKQGKTLRNDIVDVPQSLTKKLQLSMEQYAVLVKNLDELNDTLDRIISNQ